MDIGAKLLVSLVETQDTLQFFKMHLSQKMFYGDEVPLFDFVQDHLTKYNVLPKMETLTEQFGVLPPVSEPVGYYADKVEERFIFKRVNKGLVDCSEMMKVQDTWTALNLIQEIITEVRSTQTRRGVVEFTSDAHDLYMAEYVAKQGQDAMGVLLGWPYLDKLSGGLRPGDVLSIVGRPAMGKTFSLLYSAHHAMATQGKRVLVISMEMLTALIMERVVAIHTETPMTHIHKGELSTKQLKNVDHILMEAKGLPGKMWILDGNFMATVPQILSLVHQLQPDVLFIDGAYLVGHEDRRLDKYRRAEINIELIKRGVSEFGIPAVLSYQFNRQAAKKQSKKDGEEVGLEDIAHSDAIGQTSSIVLGMFEHDSVETMMSRYISIMKGRHGEIGGFRINWDFFGMDFSQMASEQDQLKSMQFV